MKEKLKNTLHAGKTKFKDAFGEVYSPDDMALMEEGMGTVEIILIIVVLIGLVLIFKKQIRAIVESIMNKISSDANSVMS